MPYRNKEIITNNYLRWNIFTFSCINYIDKKYLKYEQTYWQTHTIENITLATPLAHP